MTVAKIASVTLGMQLLKWRCFTAGAGGGAYGATGWPWRWCAGPPAGCFGAQGEVKIAGR